MHYNKWKWLYIVISFFACFTLDKQCLAAPVYTESCALASELSLPLSKWQNEQIKNPKAVILMVHGLSQRPYSLNGLATEFTAQGYIVYGATMRGHGAWHFGKNKHDDGYFCNFKDTLTDLNQIIPAIHKQYPSLPLYLLGESAGAALSLRAAVQSPDMVSGLVLCSCGTKGQHFKTSWVLADFFSSIFRPWHQLNIARYQLEYACADKNIVEKTLQDPLARTTLSGLEILKARRLVRKNTKFAKKLNENISLLVLQGACDHVFKPESAEKVLHNAPSPNKALALIPNAGHMLIGMPSADLNPQVKFAISSWLANDLSSRSLASLK